MKNNGNTEMNPIKQAAEAYALGIEGYVNSKRAEQAFVHGAVETVKNAWAWISNFVPGSMVDVEKAKTDFFTAMGVDAAKVQLADIDKTIGAPAVKDCEVRPEDRPALARIIRSIFIIEADNRKELDAIVKDNSLSQEERGEKYINTIIDHLKFVGE